MTKFKKVTITLRPIRSIVPVARWGRDLLDGKPKSPMDIELLGTGFFVSDGDRVVLVTAGHILNCPQDRPGDFIGYIWKDDEGRITTFPFLEVRRHPTFDIAVAEIHQPEGAIPLPIRSEGPPISADIWCYEYSATKVFCRRPGELVFHVLYNHHKGYIVRDYLSDYPETVPTPSFLTSFPSLQGASGAPIMCLNLKEDEYSIVGVLLWNSEQHLGPAQVVTLYDGPSSSEKTEYFLPYGKALALRALVDALDALGVAPRYS